MRLELAQVVMAVSDALGCQPSKWSPIKWITDGDAEVILIGPSSVGPYIMVVYCDTLVDYAALESWSVVDSWPGGHDKKYVMYVDKRLVPDGTPTLDTPSEVIQKLINRQTGDS